MNLIFVFVREVCNRATSEIVRAVAQKAWPFVAAAIAGVRKCLRTNRRLHEYKRLLIMLTGAVAGVAVLLIALHSVPHRTLQSASISQPRRPPVLGLTTPAACRDSLSRLATSDPPHPSRKEGGAKRAHVRSARSPEPARQEPPRLEEPKENHAVVANNVKRPLITLGKSRNIVFAYCRIDGTMDFGESQGVLMLGDQLGSPVAPPGTSPER